jgi:hypothetical protein
MPVPSTSALRLCARTALARPISNGMIPMTFKYSFTFAISGANKLQRFEKWAKEHVPNIEFSLPPQTPVKTETMTVRLKSLDDRQAMLEKLAVAKP